MTEKKTLQNSILDNLFVTEHTSRYFVSAFWSLEKENRWHHQ